MFRSGRVQSPNDTKEKKQASPGQKSKDIFSGIQRKAKGRGE